MRAVEITDTRISSTCCGTHSAPPSFPGLTHLTPIVTLPGRDHYYPHFTGEKTETRRLNTLPEFMLMEEPGLDPV